LLIVNEWVELKNSEMSLSFIEILTVSELFGWKSALKVEKNAAGRIRQ